MSNNNNLQFYGIKDLSEMKAINIKRPISYEFDYPENFPFGMHTNDKSI